MRLRGKLHATRRNLFLKHITMDTNKFISLQGQPYQTPAVKTLDIQSEGVLCESSYSWYEGGAGSYGDGDINDNGAY